MTTGLLCIHSDTTNGSTTFTDSSVNTFTITNNGAAHSTAQAKFGASSISFDASSDIIYIAKSDDTFNFGTSPFTIDCWVFVPSFSGSQQVVWDIGGTYELLRFYNGYLRVYNNASEILYTPNPTPNAWHHIAFVRDTVGFKLFVDGVLKASYADTTSTYGRNQNLTIGNYYSGSHGLIGFVDEFRVVKGEAVWTTDFTPPTEPYVIPVNDIVFTLPILQCSMQRLGTTNDIIIDLPLIETEFVCLPPRLQFDLPIITFQSESGRVGDIAFDIPQLLFSATGSHNKVLLDIDLPLFNVKFYTGARADISLPILDFDATGIVGRAGNINFELPILDFKSWTAGKGLEITLPMLELEIEGNTPIVGSMAFELPSKNFVSNGFVEIQGNIEFELPIIETVFSSGANFNITLPILDCDGGFIANTPIVGSLEFSLGIITSNMVASSMQPITMQFEIPILEMYGTADGSRYNELEISIPRLEMVSSAINNGLSNIDIVLPMLKAMFDGYYHREGGNYMDLELPMLIMMSQSTDPISASVLRHIRGQVR